MALHTGKDKVPLAAVLRQSGYKATGARIAILAYFKNHPHPLSVRQIVEGIGGTIDQATVYRTIKSLKAKNIIRQVDLRHNHAHYEFADRARHHHLICTHCGKIEDVDRCEMETLGAAVLRRSKSFASIEEHSLEFYGICKTCSKKG